MSDGQHGTLFTLAFAGAVCLVCAVLVAGSAVGLKFRQEANALRFQQRTILVAAGLVSADADAALVDRTFAERVQTIIIDRVSGEEVAVDYETWRTTPSAPVAAPENRAKVRDIAPQLAVFRVLKQDNAVDQYVLRVHGKGLWSTMRAFVALDADGRTLRGVSFYEHGETPGLGGEIENPRWNAKWVGVQAIGPEGVPIFTVTKGPKQPESTDQVEGLSGATMTSRGVEAMVRFWLGESGYGPFLERVRVAQEVTDGQ